MEKRPYGKSGEMLSAVGFGGILVSGETQEDANNYVAEAIDKGVNYFDVAPTYGNAEERLGPALVGKRSKVFLACKSEKRTKSEVEKALEESLKRLRTDHFDLYQLHSVSTLEDVKAVLGPGGALEALVRAKEKGLIRHIGFSTHSEEAAIELMNQFDFESVLFPLNWVCMLNGGFGQKIIEEAQKKGVTMLALKAMAKTHWKDNTDRTYKKCWYEPIDDKELAQLAFRYTLSKPITAAITPGYMKFFRWALEVVQGFKPLTKEEESFLLDKSQNLKPIFPQ
ncbi:MAG TPA: aldo/keto reductase [Clostridiaceae bacterium]|nr:aldo/keto reductase [Clostridiaceae bacterium]